MLRIYVRVSSDGQDFDSQLDDLRRWVTVYGNGQEVRWYEETAQGDAADRPVYKRLLRDVRKGDVVLCWSLDRLSREGIVPVLTTVQTFQKLGVRLVSVSEPWADSDNPTSEVVIAVMAWAAQMEKKRIRARQRAGIEAKRQANGKCPWGGKKKGDKSKRTDELDNLVRKLKDEGKTVVSIAKLVKLSRQTVYIILNEAA